MTTTLRFHAPYMEWAKTRPAARFDLAGSNILPCSMEDLPGAREAISFDGENEDGYRPLIHAIATRYGVDATNVTTAQGASGANFLVCAALLEPGDEVLVETPGYDPLLAAPRLMCAGVNRFQRDTATGFALDPDRVRRALTPRTRLIIVTSPHNPSGVLADAAALEAVGQIAETHGAHVLLDEVYGDLAIASSPQRSDGAPGTSAPRPPAFICTNSLTKSFGLSGLRCGWILSSPAVAERLRRTRDVVDGTGSIVAERLAALAFSHIDRLLERATALLMTNRAIMRRFLDGRDDLAAAESGGTVVFPRVRTVQDASTFAERLLKNYDTAVVPGRFFQAPPHIRIGFGAASAPLEEGLARLGAALDELT